MKHLLSQPKFATAVSLVALFVALGGSAWAISANSIGSKQLKPKSVKASDIAANAVNSEKVADGSLLAADFAIGQLPQGARGPQGEGGPTGATGPAGATGPSGPTGAFGEATTVFERAATDLPDNTNASYDVYCLPGQQAVGGGGRGDDTLSEQTILTNTRPAISPGNTEPPLAGQGFTGWRITVVNPTGGAASGIKPEVWAVCVPAPTR